MSIIIAGKTHSTWTRILLKNFYFLCQSWNVIPSSSQSQICRVPAYINIWKIETFCNITFPMFWLSLLDIELYIKGDLTTLSRWQRSLKLPKKVVCILYALCPETIGTSGKLENLHHIEKPKTFLYISSIFFRKLKR